MPAYTDISAGSGKTLFFEINMPHKNKMVSSGTGSPILPRIGSINNAIVGNRAINTNISLTKTASFLYANLFLLQDDEANIIIMLRDYNRSENVARECPFFVQGKS